MRKKPRKKRYFGAFFVVFKIQNEKRRRKKNKCFTYERNKEEEREGRKGGERKLRCFFWCSFVWNLKDNFGNIKKYVQM